MKRSEDSRDNELAMLLDESPVPARYPMSRPQELPTFQRDAHGRQFASAEDLDERERPTTKPREIAERGGHRGDRDSAS
jgi:hypothetical protein